MAEEKHYGFYGQNPSNPEEVKAETEHSLLEWAGWPKKKMPNTPKIEETSIEQAVLDKRADAFPKDKPATAEEPAPAPAAAPEAAK